MQRSFDAGAVVRAKCREARADVDDLLARHRRLRVFDEIVFEARFGRPPKIEHNLNHAFEIEQANKRLPYGKRKNIEELSQLPIGSHRFRFNCQYLSPQRIPFCIFLPSEGTRPASLHDLTLSW